MAQRLIPGAGVVDDDGMAGQWLIPAVGLVDFGGATSNAAPTFPGPNIGNQTGTVGAALSNNNVASKFSDSDALTFSAVGSWPPGVIVSSAGVISGTPTTAGTYASLKVRATDTAAQTVDSDTFSFTISATDTDATATGTPDTLDLIAPTGVGTGTAAGSTNGTGTGAFAAASLTAVAGTGAGTVAGSGTITTPVLKNNTGTVLASITNWTVHIYNAASGAYVTTVSGLSTNSSGILSITSSSLSAGTTYTYEPVHSTYGRRLPTAVAA